MPEDPSPSRGGDEMTSDDSDTSPVGFVVDGLISNQAKNFATGRSEGSAGSVLGMPRRPEPGCSGMLSALLKARRINQRRVECQ